MSETTNYVFKGLKIIAWVIFIGLCAEAGGLILNFIFSLFKPEFVQYLYPKLDLSEIYAKNELTFYRLYSFILLIAILKAYLFYLVIMMVSKIDLSKPFNNYVARQISKISYFTLSIGLVSYLARRYAKNLHHRGLNIDTLSQLWADSQAFILLAAVIYIVAIIFSKGVAYQEELEDTV